MIWVRRFVFFLSFLIANILTGLATFAGILLFIIPGLYVACRLILVPIIIADHGERNPLEALKKSWESTKDNGFSISAACSDDSSYRSDYRWRHSDDHWCHYWTCDRRGRLAASLKTLFLALGGTALQIVFTVLIGSIYYQLTGKGSDVGEVFT